MIHKLSDMPVMLESRLDGLTLRNRGKVRDIYDLGEQLLIVTTDRISAFDVVLPEGIPGKGAVLTQLSAFWFQWLFEFEDVLPHHLITTDVAEYPSGCSPYREILRGRSMLVHKATPLPVECIVRGYLAGSGWADYQRTGQVCGQSLPAGLGESQQLPEPLFTPSTKAEQGQHDLNIPFRDMEALIGAELANTVRATSLNIYRRAAGYAREKGIIIADTKLEFGIDSAGQPILIDEALTPDSSRFWPLVGYARGGRSRASTSSLYATILRPSNGTKRPPLLISPKTSSVRPANGIRKPTNAW